MSEHTAYLVNQPLSDFTRNRKLPFEETVKLLLSMNTQGLSSNLLEHFNFTPCVPSASALSQQRQKIHLSAFRFLFDYVSSGFEDVKTYKGYRLLTADGSALKILMTP